MDTKTQLKEAREAIKTKNFEKSIKICRVCTHLDSLRKNTIIFQFSERSE